VILDRYLASRFMLVLVGVRATFLAIFILLLFYLRYI